MVGHEVGREVQHAVKVGHAIRCFELQQLDRLHPELLKARQIALGQLCHAFSVSFPESRDGRRIMRLRHVNEVLAIRRKVDAVMKRRISEARVAGAIQADAVQLQLHRIIAVARRVVEQSGGFIHAHDVRDLEAVVSERDRRTNGAGVEIIEVKVIPTRAFRSPDETVAVFEEPMGRQILRPTVRPFLTHDHAALPGRWIGRDELQDVLPPVGAVEEQLFPIRRPRDAIDVMTDHGLGESLPVAHVHAHGLLGRQIVNKQVHDGIRAPSFHVRLQVQRALDARLVQREREIRYSTFVETVEGDLLVVRRPPDGGGLKQLLPIHPGGGAVLHPGPVAAIGGDGEIVGAVRRAQPQIALAIKRPPLLIGRRGVGELPPAFGPLAIRLSARRTTRRVAGAAYRFVRGRGRCSVGFSYDHIRQESRRARGDVVAKTLPGFLILECLAPVLPRHVQRARRENVRHLLGHALVTLVARHRLEPVLRDGCECQNNHPKHRQHQTKRQRDWEQWFHGAPENDVRANPVEHG